MKVGIIQSCYLPWRGYFDFIDDVDLFVIYDDVLYTRQDWRNRNRIKTAAGSRWITVPVHFRYKDRINIQDAKIDYNQSWQRKHIGLIAQAYRSAPYFDDYANDLFYHLKRQYATISQLNVALISWCVHKLDISVPLRYSSEFTAGGDRNSRLLGILRDLGCSEYLVGPSAKSYLDEDAYRRAGIGLCYKTYDYETYPQLHGDFDGSVSVIDLLFNCGPNAREYLKSRTANIRVC